jgi:hypothetical protein
MLTSDYMLAPGNGLPELHLDPLDPIDHVTQEIAARTPQGVVDKAADKLKSAVSDALGFDKAMQEIKGAATALALAIVGIIVLIFGGYLLTKD